MSSLKESFLYEKLEKRREDSSLRSLRPSTGNTDFCSNDYLGIVRNNLLRVTDSGSGSTGSRLLTGNSRLAEELEARIAAFHEAEAGLLFTSGFEANTGLLSSVASRGDTIIYDSLSHASIRDGVRLSLAEAYSFKHNDVEDLNKKAISARGNIFVVVESVYSMDGDIAPLGDIASICSQHGANLIVDEAHATGVIGFHGAGLVQELSLQHACFARVHTFGKACGAMGAIVLGSTLLRDFLINFSRNFIYTTALSPVCLSLIADSYNMFPEMHAERTQLRELIAIFQSFAFPFDVLQSSSPIQAIIIPGNNLVKKQAAILQEAGLDVRPILYPSVAKGGERLRVVLHSFNTLEELEHLKMVLKAQ